MTSFELEASCRRWCDILWVAVMRSQLEIRVMANLLHNKDTDLEVRCMFSSHSKLDQERRSCICIDWELEGIRSRIP